MHNGTVPYYKFIKRKMMQLLSDRAYGMIQGTTDSEMIFALFVTNFETLSGEQDGKEDEPYNTTKDHTQTLATAIRDTLLQVHKLALEYESKQETPDTQVKADANPDLDGANPPTTLPYTKVIGRLNVAVTNGKSAIAARYVCSDPSTAHTLYYTRGANIEYKGKMCCVAKCASSQPMVVVSSEPLGSSYECEAVPANHMVISGPCSYFSVEPFYK